jgi:PAS domain S-box-containing protein
MFEGGISFNQNSDRAIRYIALLGTPIFAGYNMLVLFGIVDSRNYVDDLTCILISVLWVIVGIFHFLSPIRSRLDMSIRIVVYHFLALSTLVFITGWIEPFASSITLLFLAANIYFGKKGLALSVVAVVAAAALDMAMRFENDPGIILVNSLGLLGILILGGAMIGVINAQEIKRLTLLNSQTKERLQHSRIETIINNLTDATLSIDQKGIVRLYNAASLNLLDTNDSLNGKHIDELLNLEDKDGQQVKLFSQLQATKASTRRDDLNYIYNEDEKIRIELTYAPIRSSYSQSKRRETYSGYIIIMRDVTKAKSLEEERDEFISVVSHELRTPITIVEGTISNVQVMMQHPDHTKEMLSDAVEMAHDQIVYLAKMVNDLSTLSRAERGVADAAEDIDVREMIHKLHDEYDKEARAKKLHLNLDLSATLGHVTTSRLYLEEMLQNFITNAIKYTKTGTVTVSVKQKQSVVKFAVKDSGIGISKSDQAKIFQKFYRSEDYRTRETSGTGLGLYVTAKLAHKVGAKIELTSRLNHGSTFSFTLPVTTKK